MFSTSSVVGLRDTVGEGEGAVGSAVGAGEGPQMETVSEGPPDAQRLPSAVMIFQVISEG